MGYPSGSHSILHDSLSPPILHVALEYVLFGSNFAFKLESFINKYFNWFVLLKTPSILMSLLAWKFVKSRKKRLIQLEII